MAGAASGVLRGAILDCPSDDSACDAAIPTAHLLATIGAAIGCVHTIRHECVKKGNIVVVVGNSMLDKLGHLDMWWCVKLDRLEVLQWEVAILSWSWLAGYWFCAGCSFFAA